MSEEMTTTKFDGYEICTSEKYERYRDLLAVVLEEDKMYTLDEIEDILQNALSQPVND